MCIRDRQLPYRGSGGLTGSKAADAQATYESLWSLWPAVLAHTNLIMHAAGWMDGGLTVSFEKFVIDLENLAMFRHFLEGFAVDEPSLALAAIAEVGPGGHHLGTSHTQERYRDAFYATSLSDRLGYETWALAGGEDAATRANRIWKEMLAHYEPVSYTHLDVYKRQGYRGLSPISPAAHSRRCGCPTAAASSSAWRGAMGFPCC